MSSLPPAHQRPATVGCRSVVACIVLLALVLLWSNPLQQGAMEVRWAHATANGAPLATNSQPLPTTSPLIPPTPIQKHALPKTTQEATMLAADANVSHPSSLPPLMPPAPVQQAGNWRSCTGAKPALWRAVFLFPWLKYSGGPDATLEWAPLKVENCSRSCFASRQGGLSSTQQGALRPLAVDACLWATASGQETDDPTDLSIRMVSGAASQVISRGDLFNATAPAILLSNLTERGTVVSHAEAMVNGTAVYLLGEMVSTFASHAYEYLAPQMLSILTSMSSPEEYRNTVIVVPTVEYTSRPHFAMEYYRMIRMAFPEFRWVEVPVDRPRMLFAPGGVKSFHGASFGCSYLLASFLWPRLRPALRELDLPRPRAVALIKMNASSVHYSKRFFSVAPDDYAEIQRRFGVVFLPEDVPKPHRMWYINNAEIFISSSGANGDINKYFVSSVESTLRVVVEFVHPDAEGFARQRCKHGDLARNKTEPYRRRIFSVCKNVATLTVEDFEEVFRAL